VAANGRSPIEGLIRTPDQRLRVFVSSTLAELADERRAVSSAISALRLTPVMFELGARPHPPRELYRAYLSQSDVFIGLYWQSYGRVAPEAEISGLEEEYELSENLPHLLYVKEPAPDREQRLSDLLSRMKQETSYRKFASSGELDRLVRDDLATLLSERFAESRGDPGSPGSRLEPVTGRARSLPAATTSLVGRDEAIDEVAGLIRLPDVRLVTLTGPGGVGKTRLAVAVGERLSDDFVSGTVFVSLADVTEPDLVLAAIGRAIRAILSGAASPLQAVIERLGDGSWLLILDNLEQASGAARDLGEVLAECPSVEILATSRTVLQLRAEREYPVPPLTFPAARGGESVDGLTSSPAVALFVDRARAVRNDFALTEGNADAVVEICRRLEGLPLAIELAASRIRLLEPQALLRRLATSLDALETNAVDVPERQRTLRATVEWSVGLLDDDERALLESMAVFVDGWTIEAAAAVAGLDEDETLNLTDALARHSLISLDPMDDGPRARMLDTVHAFVAERLEARPDADEIARRHAGYYRSLVDRADRPLRGADHAEWLMRLELETGNLAAAIRWHLAHEPANLPHLFRVLWLFWGLREHLREARSWIQQVESAADSLAPRARVELFWTAVATAVDVGNDEWALAAAQRLGPLYGEVEDPFLAAISQMVIGWTLPIEGDLEGAFRDVAGALEQLRAQDERYLMGVAAISSGNLGTALGRYEDALLYLSEARDLADRFNYSWLGAVSRAQLGTVEVLQGRLEEGARTLDEGLVLSLETNSIRITTQFLTGYSHLSLARGDADRAALLAGAAEGLRRRVGIRPWPMQRRGEAALITQIGEALGSNGLNDAFTAGSRLNLRQAVAEARGSQTQT
jgi:predicted ATPase